MLERSNHVSDPIVGQRLHERPIVRSGAAGIVRPVLHALSLLLAAAAVACMSLAVVGMISGRPSDRAGWALRAGALACFAGAVALNVAAH